MTHVNMQYYTMPAQRKAQVKRRAYRAGISTDYAEYSFLLAHGMVFANPQKTRT
jgi:hypothetical protein